MVFREPRAVPENHDANVGRISMKQKCKYSPDWTATYYDNLAEKEWDRFTQRPVDRVNHFVHTHYIQSFVKPESRVLEVGAGPGRFTQVLAGLNCRITVVDLSEVQLRLHEQYSKELSFDHAVDSRHLLDICDMNALPSDDFDAVVAYGGPLSYVFDHADTALAECVRVCKSGGHVLASVMSKWGACHLYLRSILDIPVDSNIKITDSGDLLPEHWKDVGHRCHMFTSGELRRLVSSRLRIVAMSAANCLSVNHDDHLKDIGTDSEKWKELLRMELEACAEDGCLDMGTHLIVVGQKE
jgi:2-polyprenyl-3-methyl-5-hydroxy-6-metoxy-1,4-benzoquinol methylase